MYAPICLLIGFHCSSTMKPLEVVTVDVDADAETVDEYGFSHTLCGCIASSTECREAVFGERRMPSGLVICQGRVVNIVLKMFVLWLWCQLECLKKTKIMRTLPTKNDSPFPMNWYLAEKCVQNLKRRFHKDSIYHRQYDSFIQKNRERHTAHTIVSWLNPKQWSIVHTSDLMMIIEQSIYSLHHHKGDG